jgi:hypothetical protein
MVGCQLDLFKQGFAHIQTFSGLFVEKNVSENTQ